MCIDLTKIVNQLKPRRWPIGLQAASVHKFLCKPSQFFSWSTNLLNFSKSLELLSFKTHTNKQVI